MSNSVHDTWLSSAGRTGYLSGCDCGWKGPLRGSLKAAAADATNHADNPDPPKRS